MYWANHNPEFICRVTSEPLKPQLQDNDEWITFLPPTPATSKGERLQDTVIDAMAAGFQPPEALADLRSRSQDNLAAVFPPGEQVRVRAGSGLGSGLDQG